MTARASQNRRNARKSSGVRERHRGTVKGVEVRRRANLRLIRSVLLGTVAVGLAIVWVGEQYGIERRETLSYLLTAFGFVTLLSVAGVAAGAGFFGLRKLLQRRASKDPQKSDPT